MVWLALLWPTMAAAGSYMVAAANPHAARAAAAVLADGGSAIDAAIAAQAVLTLVEPQSSGIGGGAFLLYWSAATRSLHAIDGRETAPLSATPGRFLDADGKPLPFWDAAVGGQSVGVPGVLRALDVAHRLFGRRAWATLFEPAIDLAERGFDVSPRLARSIRLARHLDRFEATRRYFFQADGAPLEAGHRLRNPALADTLRRIAADGADAFYSGPIAADIVAAVEATSRRPNNLNLADLASYRARLRDPLCVDFRGASVCGMGPPTSGGLVVGQVLGMLADRDLGGPGWTAHSVHLLAEAEKLAYADRALYAADSDYVPVPVQGLLDPAYLRARAHLIDAGRASGRASAGVPPGAEALRLTASLQPGLVGTTHLVIRDAHGDAISLTSSIESGFGSRVMVRGFLLNNQLTDFDFRPERDGRLVANRVEGGKRPRSSMSPTIVLRRGEPYLLLGSPGGSRIPGYVVKTLLGVLVLGMTPQQAINTGHAVHRNLNTLDVESHTVAETLAPALARLGHKVKARDMESGLHAILVHGDGRLEGAADERREGVVIGATLP